MIAVKCVVIGIPESARVTSFCLAAAQAGWAVPEVISWMEILDGRHLQHWNGLVRLESPGKNWSTEKALLLRGCDGVQSCEQEDPFARFDRLDLQKMSEPVGRILAMRQWYLGWRQALGEVAQSFSNATFFTTPADVALLFDKQACQEHLESAGCRMPRNLGIPVSADDLMARMEQARSNRIFLKACHGSSASAVVALEVSTRGIQAFSTVEMFDHSDGLRLYNCRPGKWRRGWREVKPLLDAVCQQRAQVQAWIPKIGWRDHRIDFRIVTIAAKARHTVVRMSRTPLTNLQLFSKRGVIEEFQREQPVTFAAARAEAEKAARCFPGALMLGVDVAVSPDGRAWVLEVNAFGDHLPGCLVDGRDTHSWQIEAMERGQVSTSG